VNASSVQEPALVLCRTPFQARLLKEILPDDTAYDLLYVTGHDSEEDRSYYLEVSRLARRSEYLIVDPHRRALSSGIELLSKLPHWAVSDRYRTILLASLDNPVFRRLVRNHPEAEMATFDDGAQSLVSDPFLIRSGQPWRDEIYGRLLGGGSVRAIGSRIARHFTVFGSLQNVVDPGRAVPIALHWPGRESGGSTNLTFFIGQPFREVYSGPQMERIKQHVRTRRLDFYVGHPRELEPLVSGVPCLAKNGLLAEDAILKASGSARPTVIAGFSTVLFTLGPSTADKVYLHLPDTPEATRRAELASKAGCEIVEL
jgi:hypothetical protein